LAVSERYFSGQTGYLIWFPKFFSSARFLASTSFAYKKISYLSSISFQFRFFNHGCDFRSSESFLLPNLFTGSFFSNYKIDIYFILL